MYSLLLFIPCFGLVQFATTLRKKHKRISGFVRANSSTQSDDVWVDVVFENDTPQPMERVAVIHKFNGVTPKTQALVWDNVGAFETTSPQRIRTAVGFWPGHFDWWVTSWRYKRVPGTYAKLDWVKKMGCQSCVKEDGTCETWVTSGGSFFMDFFTDPMTYIKGAAIAANIVVGALTLGTGAVVGTAVAGLVTEGVAGSLLEDSETSGFYSCGVRSKDYENSQQGIPIRVRTWRTQGRAHAIQIETFELGGKEDVRDVVERVNVSRNDPPLEYRHQGAPILVAREKLAIFESVKSTKVIKRLQTGERVTAAGSPRDDGSGHIMVPIKPAGAVQLKFFDVWKTGNGECLSWSNTAMPCSTTNILSDGADVPVRIRNEGSKGIKRLVLVHKHNGLTPRVRMRIFGPVPSATASESQNVQTASGFGFRADWWMAAWQEEGQECIVKSSISAGFLQQLISDPTNHLIKMSGATLETLLRTHFIGNVIDVGLHVHSHTTSELDTNIGLNGSAVDELFGWELVHLLGKNTKTDGFLKCSIGQEDVLKAESDEPVEIRINSKMHPDEGFSIHTATRTCFAQVLFMRCLQTEACAKTDACRLLNGGSVEFNKIAERVGANGAMMGFQMAIQEALTA